MLSIEVLKSPFRNLWLSHTHTNAKVFADSFNSKEKGFFYPPQFEDSDRKALLFLKSFKPKKGVK